MTSNGLQLDTKYLPTYPVILIHGFGDDSFATGSMRAIESLLAKRGIPSITLTISPIASIESRSKQAISEIRRAYPGQTVHLWGHSMGGLNARDIAYKSSQKDLGFTVSTVTTISTPNKGCKVVNILDNPVVEGFASLLRKTTSVDIDGFRELAATHMARFNVSHPDVPGIKYFSWSGLLNTWDWKLMFLPSWAIVHLTGDGGNDGLVGLESAKWGKHLGTLEARDHLMVLNKYVAKHTLEHMGAYEKGLPDPVVTPEEESHHFDKSNLRKSVLFELFLPFEMLTGIHLSRDIVPHF